jgi:7,8-dihydroneopterin aldolase/epimerase/oxygenase
MRFFAHHGLHEEETIIGAYFEVFIDISFDPLKKIVSIDETINYVEVFQIVQQIFSTPEKLLETLAQNIVEAIYETNKKIHKINISIEKLNPPITNFTGTVSVSFSKTFNE